MQKEFRPPRLDWFAQHSRLNHRRNQNNQAQRADRREVPRVSAWMTSDAATKRRCFLRVDEAAAHQAKIQVLAIPVGCFARFSDSAVDDRSGGPKATEDKTRHSCAQPGADSDWDAN